MTIEELLAHPKYHTDKIGKDIIKGCDVVVDKKSGKYEGKYKRAFCLTHGVIICRCGFELGYYLGTESKPMIVNKSPRSEYNRIYYQRKKIKLSMNVNNSILT